MDKLMDNPWFMKGVAFLLAFLLFSSVSDGNKNKSNDEYVAPSENAVTIKDVPVKSYYDTENLVVSGVPNSVELKISGPKNLVQLTKTVKDFEVYVDLKDVKIGKQKVKLKIKGISDKLEVSINPATANITVQEKVTQEFKVEAEYNRKLIEEGYIAEQPVIEPNKVLITGARDDVERITYVKATIDEKGPIQETITRDAAILVLDEHLNKLNVTVEPQTVKVTIPVKNTSKMVPIHVVQKGSPESGITIEGISLDKKEAKIIGKEDTVKEIESVRVEVDISKITENTTVTVPVIIPEGVTKVTPEVVKATIKIKKEEQRTFSNIAIKIEGLDPQFDLFFREPNDGRTSILVKGPSDALKEISASDFVIFINAEKLGEGEHEVPILSSGPNSVSWRLEKSTTRISIVKKSE